MVVPSFLPRQQYTSKQKILADLHLIWSNCLYSNYDLTSPLRAYAPWMSKDIRKLLLPVPERDDFPILFTISVFSRSAIPTLPDNTYLPAASEITIEY